MAFSFSSPAAPTAAPSPLPAFSFSQPAQTSQPAFSFAASQPAPASNAFQLPGSTAPAAGTSSIFGQFAMPSASAAAPQTSSALSLWGAPAQQQAQQQAQPKPAFQLSYASKFDDLPPEMQKGLLEIQTQIGRYREDCDKLSREQRLYDSAAMKKAADQEAETLKQGLQGMLSAVKSDDQSLDFMREKVMQLLRSTESAVKTFQRSKLWRDAPQQYRGQQIPPQVQELLSAPVQLPSPYLEAAVLGFSETLQTYKQVMRELESAVPSNPLGAYSGETGVDTAHSLPIIVSHLHDYFVHVAAQLEQLHSQVEVQKASFLSQRRAAGEMSDPFAESRRYESSVSAGSGGLKTSLSQISMQAASHTNGIGSHAHMPHLALPAPGHQLHAGSPHGPAAAPSPGAFGTPLGSTGTFFTQPAPVAAATPDSGRSGKSSKRR